MSDLNNIKDLNIRLLFKGKGALDGKSAVDTHADMQALVVKYFEYFNDNDIIWVREERKYYTLKLITGQHPYFEFHELRLGSKGLIYGGENDIYQYNYLSNPDYKPSNRGYRNNEVIVVGDNVFDGLTKIYKQYDMYEVIITSTLEEYKFSGQSLIGAPGSDGSTGGKGDKGDRGDNFNVDVQGRDADKGNFCSENEGFAFFATDTSLVYFKTSAAGAQPCTWSSGVPFGKGDPGETTFFAYRWSDVAGGPGKPSDGALNPPTGWYDSPGSAPHSGEKLLWSTQSKFRADSNGDPVPGETPIWSNPTQINGDKGLDGREGIDAGFWVIWSAADDPTKTGIAKPIKASDGTDTWTQGTSTDWVDDIDDIPGQEAKWMASSLYNNKVSVKDWGPWTFSKIAGETPAYKINLFKRMAAAGSAPTTTIPYFQADGSLTTGSQAASLVGGGWSDAPNSGSNKLFFTEIIVSSTGANKQWSAPVQLDGEEGKDAGIFTVWSDLGSLPTLPINLNQIYVDPDGINLTTSPGWYDDVVAPSNDPVWMATSMWRLFDSGVGGKKWQWTGWKATKVKGEDGSNGTPGNPGKAGGTVIMVSSQASPVPDEPTRPSNPTNSKVDESQLENAAWKMGADQEDAIFLAVMTFGETTDNPFGAWSDWRITKIKGEDGEAGEDGATVPPGSAIFSNVWGNAVEEGWSIASGGYNAGFAGNLSGGTSKLTGPSTLPLAIYGGRNYLGIPVTSTPTHTETFGQIEINYRAIWYPQAAQLIFSMVDGLTVTLHAPSGNQSYITLQGGYNVTSNNLTKRTFYDGDEYWGKMYALKTLGGPWLLDNVPAGTGSFLVSKIFNEFDNGYDIIQDVRVANSISGQTQRKTLTYLLVSKSSNTLYIYAGVNGISQNDTYGTWPIITEKYDFALAASTVTYYDRSDSQLPTNESAITHIKYPQFAYEIITKYSSAAKATSYEVMWSYTKASATSPNTHTKMFTDAPGTAVKLHTQGSQLQINSYIYVQVRGINEYGASTWSYYSRLKVGTVEWP